MRRTLNAIFLAVVLSAVALGGCGGSSNTTSVPRLPPITKVTSVPLSSAAVRGERLPARYTCDGKNVSPPLKWGAVPSGIEELALYAIGIPDGSGRRSKSVEWAMAGVNPSLHRLRAGEVPPGAFVVESSDGKKRYSICPAKGTTKHYEFALYALPSRVRATPELPGTRLLGNLTGKIPQGRSPAVGKFSATYTRR